MDRRGDETSSSGEVRDWDWELEQVEKVAARFPEFDKEELAAELAKSLLALKRPTGIRDWKAYLIKALFNRASSIAKKWRTLQRRETSIELHPETAQEASRSEEADSRRLESRLKLSKIRRRLDAESYALLKLLADSGENQSRVARLLGKHRNTIRRRLQKIRQALLRCPIENVSGRSAVIQRQPSRARLQLTAEQQEQLTRLALAASRHVRNTFKARLILALASGQSYRQIEQTLKTTAPTISRWKRRFEKNGMDGLKAKHHGRKPRTDSRTLLADWLRPTGPGSEPGKSLSYRKIARELGISKSTVHRIVKGGRISGR
jgi:transposase